MAIASFGLIGSATIRPANAANQPTFSIGSASISEGNGAKRTLSIPVTLSDSAATQVSVDYAVADDLATSPSDYKATSGTIVFKPATSTGRTAVRKFVSIAVYGDAISEGDETFLITLSNASPGSAIGNDIGVGTILDDEAQSTSPPTVTAGSAAIAEGDSGSKRGANVSVVLNAPSLSTVTVAYALTGVTADPGIDFLSRSGSLTFKPGQVAKHIAVSVVADTAGEADETAALVLTSAVNADIAPQQGVITIIDDDVPPQATTSTSMYQNPTSYSGEATTFFAGIGHPIANEPTGTVDFFDGAQLLGTAAASSSAVALTVTGLSAGTHFISARYNGDANHLPSTSAVMEHTVIGAAIYTWGGNTGYRLGDLNMSLYRVDPAAAHIGDWESVAPGEYHAAAIRDDGTLWAWGLTDWLEGSIGSASAVQVGTDSDWVVVAAGATSIFAIKDNGTMWVAGASVFGSHPTMTHIATGEQWTALSSSGSVTFAIRADGTLWGWGVNDSHQLGDGSIGVVSSPLQIGTASDWVMVDTEGPTSYGIRSDGSLWAWGTGYLGQLGLGVGAEVAEIPTRVGTDLWLDIDAGGFRTSAVRADGTLWNWGLLAQNSTQLFSIDTPQQLGTDSDWVKTSSDSRRGFAIKADGTLWQFGLVRIETYTTQTFVAFYASPTQVGTATNWVAIEAEAAPACQGGCAYDYVVAIRS